MNADPAEIQQFDALANRWWDPQGPFKPLHDLNPLRLNFIEQHASLFEKAVLDVGCGGGILSEALAKAGAKVTGIDLAEATLKIAHLHQLESELNIDYQVCAVEDKAPSAAGTFDVVTCMELLEHVPDPASVIQACATLVKPGGHVFFSTLNRHPKAYVQAILGAEYLLKLLPRGTHDYSKFITPAELTAWARDADLSLHNMTGLTYNPLNKRYRFTDSIKVNYLVHFTKAMT